VSGLFLYFLEWSSALNTLLKRIPENQLDSYRQDFIEHAKEHKWIKFVSDNEKVKKIHAKYQMLVVFATKSA
jgi:hypothetical protein